jgi:hypothetical protein
MRETDGTGQIPIEDWKGNESQTMTVPVKIVAKGAKEQKPRADFKEVAIGAVMLDTDLQRPY